MPAITFPKKPPAPAPPREPSGVCRLTLSINGSEYRVRGIIDRSGRLTFRLISLTDPSRSYDVRLAGGGVSCSCPDFRFRRSWTPEGCKHTRALIALGLLPTPR